jgi:hypothetical protein
MSSLPETSYHFSQAVESTSIILFSTSGSIFEKQRQASSQASFSCQESQTVFS